MTSPHRLSGIGTGLMLGNQQPQPMGNAMADRGLLSMHIDMQQQVLQDKKSVELIIQSKIHQLLYDTASITGMT